jgi:hypothetical protein
MMAHDRRRASKPGCVILIGLALITLLTACSGNRSHSAQPALSGAIEVITTPQQVQRPVDLYLPSAADLIQLNAIQLTRTNTCLSAAGEELMQVQGDVATVDEDAIADRVSRSSLWGAFDPADMQAYGYALPPGRDDSLGLMFPNSSTGMACVRKGQDAVGGASGAHLVDESVLPAGGPPAPIQDSRVVAAYRSWSQCMHRAGYAYSDPVAAMLAWPRSAGHAASNQEITTATADGRCKLSTNLVGITLAVQLAYDQRYIDQHQQQLVAFKNSWQSLLRAGGTK